MTDKKTVSKEAKHKDISALEFSNNLGAKKYVIMRVYFYQTHENFTHIRRSLLWF